MVLVQFEISETVWSPSRSKKASATMSIIGPWGTRHQSAAQFVFDQKDAIAFVASVDVLVSVIRWNPVEGKVSVIRPAEFALL